MQALPGPREVLTQVAVRLECLAFWVIDDDKEVFKNILARLAFSCRVVGVARPRAKVTYSTREGTRVFEARKCPTLRDSPRLQGKSQI